jgi:hypothetical protein
MGAPSYQWNDITPKYEYRTGIWNTSHRSGSFDYSSSCVTSCVDSSPCGPSVVLFSPNAESFTINYKKSWFGSEVSASATSSMSGSWAPDGLFGNYLSQNVEFTMTDLLYQVPKCPHAPYLITLNCAVDPGTCPDDTIDPETGAITAYSPPAGMFEARCDYPAGAPTASGVVFPIMAKPEISGNPGYDFNVYQQPWNTYANMQVVCADTASTCRFLRFYNCS